MQRLFINFGMVALVATTIAACSSSTPTAETKSEASKSDAKTELVKTDSGAANKDDSKQKEGDHKHDGTDGHGAHGETVAVDGYNLELSQHKEGKVAHLHLLLQKGEKREPVTDAKVTAQIQLPDGSSKSLDLAYKLDEKVYAAEMTDFSAGSYKVAVLSEVSGKKVNARFNLKI